MSAAIRSRWGIEIHRAVDEHMEGLSESLDAEPVGDVTVFLMLNGTRRLTSELLQAKEFGAAFFFAHAPAAMIRRCEGTDEADDPKKVEKWAKELDGIMAGAVKGWRAKSGTGQKQKKDAAAMVKLLVNGEKAEGCDQAKWYPETLKELKEWTKAK